MRKATLFNIRMSFLKIASIILLVSSVGASAQGQTDCPPLTVFCQDLHTSFMPDACMVEVWAKDFISKINDPDTDLDDFIISFEEDSEVMSRTYESIFGDSYEVTIWVTSRCDPSDQTRCVVTLDINDNTGSCPIEQCPIDVNPWCGYAVVTCTTVQGTSAENTGHVAQIIDTRKNSQAPRGDDWSNPTNSASPVDRISPDAWRINNIGNVYGIGLSPNTGEIFLSASDVYDYDFQQFVTVGPPPPSVSGPAGPGGIYRTSFDSPETVTTLVNTRSNYPSQSTFDAAIIGGNSIPNTGNIAEDSTRSGNGIGNIDFDLRSNHLFATNLEDGKIYSIDVADGTITDVYDPFNAYVHTDGLVQSGEQLWGIAIDDCSFPSRVYFARGARTPSAVPDVTDNKEIWSIALNTDGTFVGSERIEIIVDRGDQSKLTDLAFSVQCHELLASERGNPHSSEVHRFRRQADDSWIYQKQFFVGINDLNNRRDDYPGGIRGNSSAGGVSYGPGEQNCVVDAACNDLVWATMNCGDIAADDNNNPPTPFECAVYGIQGITRGGNNPTLSSSTDIFVSLDTSSIVSNTLLEKSNIGDVEIFNCCCIFDGGRDTINSGVAAIIAGEIRTENKTKLEKVNVSLLFNQSNESVVTNNSGEYLFEELTMHGDYILKAEMDGNIIDGLTTLDLLLTQRHILNLEKLDSPYRIIAADINNDRRVSVQDLVVMRRLILGQNVNNKLPVWSFVPSSFIFDDPLSPFPYNEQISLFDLEENFMHEDFIAVKKGDVNGDNQYELNSKGRSYDRASIIVDIQGSRGFVRLNKDINLSGIQFELNSDMVISEHVSQGKIDVSNSNISLTDDGIRVSWSSDHSVMINNGDVLFSFDILSDAQNNIFSLSREFVSQAYDEKFLTYDLILENHIDFSSSFNVTNSPNPFYSDTRINYDLESDQEILATFYSTSGELLYSRKLSGQKGLNSMTISSDDLGGSSNSIIFYTLQSARFRTYGKMIMLKER